MFGAGGREGPRVGVLRIPQVPLAALGVGQDDLRQRALGAGAAELVECPVFADPGLHVVLRKGPFHLAEQALVQLRIPPAGDDRR